jgi:hypothetical protein
VVVPFASKLASGQLMQLVVDERKHLLN